MPREGEERSVSDDARHPHPFVCASVAHAKHTKAYIANQGSNTVTVIDDRRIGGHHSPIVATIPVGANPIAVAVSADGMLAYVANLNRTIFPSSRRRPKRYWQPFPQA
jgi:hypothetical protein